MLPPDALWPRLRDAGRTVISHSSASLTQYGTGCRDENLPLLHSIVDQQRDGRLSLENPHIYLPAWTVYRRERDSEQMKEYRKLSNLYCLLYLTCDASTVRQNCGDGMYHRLWVGLFITGTASMLVLIWYAIGQSCQSICWLPLDGLPWYLVEILALLSGWIVIIFGILWCCSLAVP